MNDVVLCPLPNTLLTDTSTVTDMPTSTPSTQTTTEIIMHEVLVEPEDLGVRTDLALFYGGLRCRAGAPDGGGGGGGTVRWYAVEKGNEVGHGNPLTSNYKPLTTEVAVATADTDYTRTGYMTPPVTMPFYLVLAAKVDDAADTITTWWKTSTTMQIAY